jgi:hypothetical protein
LQLEIDPHAAAIDALHAATAIYTRSKVVEGLLDRLSWPQPGKTLLDPAAGDGSFLLQALKRLDLPPDNTETALLIQGWEIHPGAATEARRRVAAHLLSNGWSAGIAENTARRIVIHADYLTNDDAGVWDVIAGNPPYLRFANLPDFFKGKYTDLLPIHAKSDLMHSFLDACCRRLSPTGRLGFVTADRWAINESAGQLREQLGKYVGISHIKRLDCASSFYRPKHRRTGTPPRIHPIEVVLEPVRPGVHALSKSPISLVSGLTAIPNAGTSLGQVADVWLGPWLGPKGVFIIDEDIARTLPDADLVPIVDARRDLHKNDTLRDIPRLLAIRTSPRIAPPSSVQAHLDRHWAFMPKKCQKRSGPGAAWLPPETITKALDRPALMIPRIASRLRVIDLPAGHLPVNHAITVVAAPGGADLDRIRQHLLSAATQEWIACHAPPLENGFLSITTQLIRSIPVPESFLESRAMTSASTEEDPDDRELGHEGPPPAPR